MRGWMRFDAFRRSRGSSPFVYGHRGVRGAAPENTMLAFERAATAGASGVELDVRPCKTGEIVVFHDATLTRCSGGKDDRLVSEVPWSDLARTDLGEGARVPLLDEVLGWARGRGMRVNVELKRDVPDRKRLVVATADRIRALPDRASTIVVSSFDGLMLVQIGRLLPEVARGFLYEPDRPLFGWGWPAPLLGAAAVHPERTRVTAAACRAWRLARLLVNVWTVNDPEEARRLRALGVDAIITDRPAVIVEALR